MLELEFAQASDPGRVRVHNEDYLGYVAGYVAGAMPAQPQAHTQGWLFALADGVGGHDKGEVASRTAIETLVAGFRRAPDRPPLPYARGRNAGATRRVAPRPRGVARSRFRLRR